MSPKKSQVRPIMAAITNKFSTQITEQRTPTKSLLQDFLRTRVLNEIELVFKEYQKCVDYTQNKSSITYSKMQFFDPEKWRKKFKLLFDRENIIDFKQPLSMTMGFK